MMLFGGTYHRGRSHNKWENYIWGLFEDELTPASKIVIQTGFDNLKKVRKLLYDISISLFNQLKGHRNVLNFDVEAEGSNIKIKVEYNKNEMNKILYQTYLNKKFNPDTKEAEEWGDVEDKETEFNYVINPTLLETSIYNKISNGEPVYCMYNGDIINLIDERDNLEEIAKYNIGITHNQMNERVYELNNLFASFGDGQEILLLT